MSEIDYEKRLEEAGDNLGNIMEKSSKEEKSKLALMHKEIDDFVESSEKEGKHFEKTSFFAAAILSSPDLSEDMKKAAKAYIEADYAYVNSLAEKSE